MPATDLVIRNRVCAPNQVNITWPHLRKRVFSTGNGSTYSREKELKQALSRFG